MNNTKLQMIHVFQFVYEGMEESGSEGLDDLLFARKDTFLKVSTSSRLVQAQGKCKLKVSASSRLYVRVAALSVTHIFVTGTGYKVCLLTSILS